MRLAFAILFSLAGCFFIPAGVYLGMLETSVGGACLILAGAVFAWQHFRVKRATC